MAINDWCETDDSRDDAISNFERNRKTIESIAWQLLNDNATMSERGVYEIRGQDLERHQPEPRN